MRKVWNAFFLQGTGVRRNARSSRPSFRSNFLLAQLFVEKWSEGQTSQVRFFSLSGSRFSGCRVVSRPFLAR